MSNISIKLNNIVKVGGSFKITKYDKDGNVILSLPEQKNLITNLGLLSFTGFINYDTYGITNRMVYDEIFHQTTVDFFKSRLDNLFVFSNYDPIGASWPSLVLGSGTGTPSYNDKLLFKTCYVSTFKSSSYKPVGGATSLDYGIEDVNEDHPNHYRVYRTYRYNCVALYEENFITELGLASQCSDNYYTYHGFEKGWLDYYKNRYPGPVGDHDYYTNKPDRYSRTDIERMIYTLLTHSMIKDENGNLTGFSLSKDELLTVDYTLNLYVPKEPFRNDIIVQHRHKDGSIDEEEFETITFLANAYFGFNRNAFPLMSPITAILGNSYYDYNHYVTSGIVKIYSEEALEGFDFTKVTLNDWIEGCSNLKCNSLDELNRVSNYANKITTINYNKIQEDKVDPEYRVLNIRENHAFQKSNGYNEYENFEYDENGKKYFNYYITNNLNALTFNTSYLLSYSAYRFPTIDEYAEINIPDKYSEFATVYPTLTNYYASKSILFHPYTANPKDFTKGARIRAISMPSYISFYNYTSTYRNIDCTYFTIFRSKSTGRGLPKNNKRSLVIKYECTFGRWGE